MKKYWGIVLCLSLASGCATIDERAIERLNARGIAEPKAEQIAGEITQLEANAERRKAAAIELAGRVVADIERELGKAETDERRVKAAKKLERFCNYAQEAVLAAILIGADPEKVDALQRRLDLMKEAVEAALSRSAP